MNTKRLSRISFIVLVMTLLISGSSGVYAQEVGRWEKLGERSVDLFIDKDIIECGHKGTFTAIRFHVAKAPVNFMRVLVKYANGAVDDLNFNQLVPAGANSRYLDLRGNRRVIKQVIVYYKSEKRGPGHHPRIKKAKVQVWGRH
ncbi:hypothetical protein [Bacteroides sp.]|uniref:hypothetical protein n=1 Tax=Bacteroides sp. TaxID=29523 RepID=UPI002604735C|nr:hypothetical protein [Bacteroides sp.]